MFIAGIVRVSYLVFLESATVFKKVMEKNNQDFM